MNEHLVPWLMEPDKWAEKNGYTKRTLAECNREQNVPSCENFLDSKISQLHTLCSMIVVCWCRLLQPR